MGKEAILRGVAEVEIERDIYREMVQVLLGQAHERKVAADRTRKTIRQHRQDDRRVRERADLHRCGTLPPTNTCSPKDSHD